MKAAAAVIGKYYIPAESVSHWTIEGQGESMKLTIFVRPNIELAAFAGPDAQKARTALRSIFEVFPNQSGPS